MKMIDEIFNDDVLGINSRFNRYITEAQKCASANVADVSGADMARLQSYMSNLSSHIDWVVSIPALDLPETHPLSRPVPAGPDILALENEHLNDVVRLLVRGRDELLHSQSSRNATNLIAFDESRLRAVIDKTNQLLAHIAAVSPIDLPESSPKQMDSGSGRRGINP
jgi:hypothetical protein